LMAEFVGANSALFMPKGNPANWHMISPQTNKTVALASAAGKFKSVGYLSQKSGPQKLGPGRPHICVSV